MHLNAYTAGFLEKAAFLGAFGGKALQEIGAEVVGERAYKAIYGDKEEEEKPVNPALNQRIMDIDPAMYARLEEAGLIPQIEDAFAAEE